MTDPQIKVSGQRAALQRPSRRPIWQSGLAILIVAAFLAVVGYQSWLTGTQLRNDIWTANRGNHFSGDIENAFAHGRHVLDLARSLDATRHRADGGKLTALDQLTIWQLLQAMSLDYKSGPGGLDYPPGRLFVASLWARWAAAHFPRLGGWTDSPRAFVSEPMLRLNTWAAAESAVAMFFLVFLWVLRSGRRDAASGAPPEVEKWWPCHGALAAIASAWGLVLLIRLTAHEGDWPDDRTWFAMAALFLTLIISVRRLPTAHRAWACGLIAAEMLWFDPAVLAVSHVWPQWDVWCVPFFVTAALVASLNLWFLAGALLAGGAMFKAQSLLGAPILFLWPIFAGRWGAAWRIAGGFLAGGVALLWTFLVPSADYTFLTVNPELRQWIERIAVLAAVVALVAIVVRLSLRLIVRWRRRGANQRDRESLIDAGASKTPDPFDLVRRPSGAAIVLVTLVVSAMAIAYAIAAARMQPPFSAPSDRFAFRLLVAAIIVLPWLVRVRHIPAAVLTTAAAGVLLGQFFFGYASSSNWGWYNVGFVYGTDKFPNIQMGVGDFSNLPVLLTQMRWISGDIHELVGSLTLPVWGEVDIDRRMELAIVYGAALLICAAAAARHARRNDPRILIALAAPWVLFPALLPQMSERYLLMSSAISAAVIGASGGMTLLHLLLGATGAMMTMDQIRTSYGNEKAFTISAMAGAAYPNSGWIVVTCALLFLVAATLPSRPAPAVGAWTSLRTCAARHWAQLVARARAVVDFFAPLAMPAGGA